jgi:hypothetical protein
LQHCAISAQNYIKPEALFKLNNNRTLSGLPTSYSALDAIWAQVCEEANVGLSHKFGCNQSPSLPPQLLLFPLRLRPCSAGQVSACFSLFQLILFYRTLLNQPKSADFFTSRTSPSSLMFLAPCPPPCPWRWNTSWHHHRFHWGVRCRHHCRVRGSVDGG